MSDQPIITLNDGVAMPQFGLGVWQTPQDEAASVVKTALDAGYLAVDTAAIYGNERGVGEGLRASDAATKDIFVTTKLWNDRQGFDSTLAACDSSLGRLGLEAVDLYLIHWPAPKKDLYLDTWKAMIRLKEEGKVRSVGVSNFAPEQIQRLIDETGVTPSVNQIELHPAFQQLNHRKFHQQHNIATQSWSPLGQGKELTDPTIGKIAAKHGKTPAQIIIRWHLDSGLIVIPKSVTPSRIRENIAVFDFTLDTEDMASVAALDSPQGRVGPDPMTANF